ncbi:MAG: VWA domain-containing protein, partial [Deltaproteobacteria bacterium]|nr:VWA domain-containing protein [Deltaproteobacteria bacterium]
MKENFTELVFILDKSSSMSSLTRETIEGFNSFIEKLQNERGGQILLTTILFNHNYTVLHDRVDLKEIKPLTKRDYLAQGCTALLDAIGKTLLNIQHMRNNRNPEENPDQVLFVITTDGEENSSREFSTAQIKQMVSEKQESGWEFIFLGANIDAFGEAGQLGIPRNRAQTFAADSDGIKLNYRVLGDLVCDYHL